MEFRIILILFTFFEGIISQLPDLSQCPLADPDCHPWCIEYVNKCRVCRCKTGFNSGSSYSSGSGSSGGGAGFEKWSTSGGSSGSETNGGSWSGSSSNEGERTKVIVIEKERKPDIFPMTPFSGSSMGAPSPFLAEGHAPGSFGSPFPVPASFKHTSIPEECKGHIRNVKCKLGVPLFCETGRLIDCPDDCVVTDEYGCKSCPCMSASKLWIPVCDVPKRPAPKKPDCLGTRLCLSNCDGKAEIGETGPDGCQKCTCIKKEHKAPTTTPKPRKDITECDKLIKCMMKCKDTGFELKDVGSDGCPECRCKEKHKDTSSGGSGMMQWTTAKPNNGAGGGGAGFGGSGNNFLTNTGNGVSTDSSGCKPPMCMGGSTGFGGGSGGGGDGGGCAGPFCASGPGTGSGGGIGGSGGGMGGSGGGMGGSGGGMGGAGGQGPFASSLISASSALGGGGGGGGGMMTGGSGGMMAGGGGGMGGMKSPFSSGAAGSNPMQGPMAPLNPGKPTQTDVEQKAYNKDCFGPSCSAKNGKAHGLIGDCIELATCIATCDGSYLVGDSGPDGCQSCTCSN